MIKKFLQGLTKPFRHKTQVEPRDDVTVLYRRAEKPVQTTHPSPKSSWDKISFQPDGALASARRASGNTPNFLLEGSVVLGLSWKDDD